MSNCGCGHCNCDETSEEKTSEEKIAKLEKEIENLGYKIEKTPEGDIKISE